MALPTWAIRRYMASSLVTMVISLGSVELAGRPLPLSGSWSIPPDRVAVKAEHCQGEFSVSQFYPPLVSWRGHGDVGLFPRRFRLWREINLLIFSSKSLWVSQQSITLFFFLPDTFPQGRLFYAIPPVCDCPPIFFLFCL